MSSSKKKRTEAESKNEAFDGALFFTVCAIRLQVVSEILQGLPAKVSEDVARLIAEYG